MATEREHTSFPGNNGEPPSGESRYSTMQRHSRPAGPGKTFSGRSVLFFVLTAIATTLVFALVLAVVWERRFESYSHQRLQQMADRGAIEIARCYEDAGGWSDDVSARAAALDDSSDDASVQVLSSAGEVIYDGSDRHPDRLIPSLSQTDASKVVDAPIVDASGTVVGTVRMWSLGSGFLLAESDNDLKMDSYQAIIEAGIISVIAATVIGYFASRRLLRPIRKITYTAMQIRNGDLTARTGLKGDDEVGRLGETFDGMASELERDIKFEHRLTSDVAHELRTPLMAMIATVEAMQDGVLPTDSEHLETVDKEVRRLSRLVDAMLHLSRLENGSTELKVERTDLVTLVKSLVSVQQQLFADQGLRLNFDDRTHDHRLVAEVSPDLIREALTNLMSNALRYTPEGGQVLVSVGRGRGGMALLSVQDTGMGIAKEDVSRVFSRFWRSDASRDRVSGGLGVGLALTKEIVGRHNGAIDVESELGKGTTFTIRIPLVHKESLR